MTAIARRPINADRLAELWNEHQVHYIETHFIAFSPEGIQIRSEGMAEIAALEDWTRNEYHKVINAYRHTYSHPSGVTFYAISNEPVLLGSWAYETDYTAAPSQAQLVDLYAHERDCPCPSCAGEADEGDPAEGWLADSYAGQFDDDPSPYDGNYSED